MMSFIRKLQIENCKFILLFIILFFTSSILFAELPSSKKLLDISKIDRGLFVCLDCDNPALIKDIAATGRFLVHGITSDEASAITVRKQLMAARLSGLACVEALSLDRLPYTKNMVDLLTANDFPKLKTKGVTLAEIVRDRSKRNSKNWGLKSMHSRTLW
jgi:hypothetical protein